MPQPIPEGFHTVTPYLLLQDAAKLIEFLQQAFGGVEKHRSTHPSGRIVHAQVTVGDSQIMLGEPPASWQAMPGFFYLYVNDVDATYNSALTAGAVSVSPLKDEFYGDRTGGVKDPFGNLWWIATHKEDVPEEELKRRIAANAAS